MVSVHFVDDPRQAAMLAAPLRQRILEALDVPGSASTMARTLGLARQKVAYHVRQLEEHGFVELVREFVGELIALPQIIAIARHLFRCHFALDE